MAWSTAMMRTTVARTMGRHPPVQLALLLVLVVLSSTAAQEETTEPICMEWGVGEDGVKTYFQDADCCSGVEQAACADGYKLKAGEVCERWAWGCTKRTTICEVADGVTTMRTAEDPPRDYGDYPCMKPTPIQLVPFILGLVGSLNVVSFHWGCQKPRWQDDPCRCDEAHDFDNSPRMQNQPAMVRLQLWATVALSFLQASSGIIMVHYGIQWGWGLAHTILGLWALIFAHTALRRFYDRQAGLPVGNQARGERPLVRRTAGEPWLPARPAAESMPSGPFRLLHLAFFPLTIAMASLEWIIQAYEAANLLVLIPACLCNLFLIPLAPIWLIFASYEQRQEGLDKLDDDNGSCTYPALAPAQMALAFASRFGPRAAYIEMLLCGSLPSGSTHRKTPNDCWSVQVMNGGQSAIARAFARGEPATVAFLLHAAPNLEPRGTYWDLKQIRSRHDIERWVEDCYNGEAERKAEAAAEASGGSDPDVEEHEGFEYKLNRTRRTWHEHETEAKEWGGGHLASVTSDAEQQFLEGLCNGLDTKGFTGPFVGGQRIGGGGNGPGAEFWKWTDGSPWAFTAWGRGEPNNYKGREDCVQLCGEMGLRWNDIHSGHRAAAIYKRKKQSAVPHEAVAIEMQPMTLGDSEVSPSQSNQPSLVDRFRELSAAKESGVLSEEEFLAARLQLLDSHVSM